MKTLGVLNRRQFMLQTGAVTAGCALGGMRWALAQGYPTFKTPQELLLAMIAREKDSALHHDKWQYMNNERSDRTTGRLWTERVIETEVGRVRLLIAEDGKPLAPAREQAERAKLNDILVHPDDFARREQAQKNEDEHSRTMLDMLTRGFILENVRLENGIWTIDFRPNPSYSPSGIEERVLHGMSGWVSVSAPDLRLAHVEARLPQDVGIGFGLLATVKAGSHFMSDRKIIDGHWHTTHLITDIRGKAILFKSVGRNSDWVREDFTLMPPTITPAQAVAILQH